MRGMRRRFAYAIVVIVPAACGGLVASVDSGAVVDAGAGLAVDAPTASPPCPQYPPGPYGAAGGMVVDPSFTWEGYLPGASKVGPIRVRDFFDCDGRFGINALLVIESVAWEAGVRSEALTLNDELPNLTALGVKVLFLLVQGQSTQKATLLDLQPWRALLKIESFTVAIDPDFSFSVAGTNGVPLNIVVDPRTMKVHDRTSGWDPAVLAPLKKLAETNKP